MFFSVFGCRQWKCFILVVNRNIIMLYVDLKVGNNFHPLKGFGCKEILVQITYLLYSYMLRCCQLKTLGIAKKVPKSIGIR